MSIMLFEMLRTVTSGKVVTASGDSLLRRYPLDIRDVRQHWSKLPGTALAARALRFISRVSGQLMDALHLKLRFLTSAGTARVRIPLLLLLIGVAVPHAAVAQQYRFIQIRFDNDALALRGSGAPPDHDYTHGVQLMAEFPSIPRPFRRWMGAEFQETVDPARARTRVSLGQRIYTPRRDGREPISGERPHAGWLFWSADAHLSRARTEHQLGVELGITGPAALGKPVQNGFHRMIGSPRQEGWDHQLLGEPAGLVRYRVAWPRDLAGAHVRPQVELGLGTLWSGAVGGLELRFGARPEARGPYAEGEVRQEWVARNLFLDGNTFRGSIRVDKHAWVREAALRVGYALARWDVDYRLVVRSREYAAQPRPHGYGSLALKWRM